MLGRRMSNVVALADFWIASRTMGRPKVGRRLTRNPDWSSGATRSSSSIRCAVSHEIPRSVTRSVRSVCKPECGSVHTTCGHAALARHTLPPRHMFSRKCRLKVSSI